MAQNGGIIGPVKCLSTPTTKVTSFTSSGTFNVANCSSKTASEVLVVGGGGASGNGRAGGGGIALRRVRGYETSSIALDWRHFRPK